MKGHTPKLHQYRGTWMTARQIADITGLKPRTVHRRLQFGLPMEQPHRCGPEPRRYEFRGELKTAREIMAITGLSRSQVSKRTDGVRFVERDEPTDPYADLQPNCRVITYRGIKDSVAGWARRTGIPHHAIYERIFGMRWPIKRALTEPVMRKGQRQRYQRNAEIIARMLTGFATATSHAPARTGGYQPTFQTSPGTGAGRHETDFDAGENPKVCEFASEVSP